MGQGLIVDDDPAFRQVLRNALDGLADTVVEAEDGRAVLDMDSRHRPDVIFLDMCMPDVDGVEVLAALADDETLRDVPVIVVTALDVGQIDSASVAHAAVVLDKSKVSRRAVEAALREALARRRYEAGPSPPAPGAHVPMMPL
nr:response regulator [Couchioplanes caeruleus]